MKTILLVDDSIAVRMVGAKISASLGLKSFEAENGKIAIDVLREHPEIDVVLLDWNMPIMDGMQFLKQLQSDADLPKPRIIMCTTENDMTSIVEAMQNGAHEYIMKPFTEEIVREKLEEAGIL